MSYFRDVTKTDAFKSFGARTKNPLNEYSAISPTNGDVVLECWDQYIDDKRPDGSWRYEVDMSNWNNSHGKGLLLQHMQIAFDENRNVRLVIARFKNNPHRDVAGIDGSKEDKDIWTRPERIGRVTLVTNDRLIVDFRKQISPGTDPWSV